MNRQVKKRYDEQSLLSYKSYDSILFNILHNLFIKYDNATVLIEDSSTLCVMTQLKEYAQKYVVSKLAHNALITLLRRAFWSIF